MTITNNFGDTPLITAAEHNIHPTNIRKLLERVDESTRHVLEVTNDQGNNIAHYLCDDLFCAVESYGHYLHHPAGDGTTECKEYTKQLLDNLKVSRR